MGETSSFKDMGSGSGDTEVYFLIFLKSQEALTPTHSPYPIHTPISWPIQLPTSGIRGHQVFSSVEDIGDTGSEGYFHISRLTRYGARLNFVAGGHGVKCYFGRVILRGHRLFIRMVIRGYDKFGTSGYTGSPKDLVLKKSHCPVPYSHKFKLLSWTISHVIVSRRKVSGMGRNRL